jgi:hypothetical protein
MREVEKLNNLIQKNREDFVSIPRSIVPLTIICQGLPKR